MAPYLTRGHVCKGNQCSSVLPFLTRGHGIEIIMSPFVRRVHGIAIAMAPLKGCIPIMSPCL